MWYTLQQGLFKAADYGTVCGEGAVNSKHVTGLSSSSTEVLFHSPEAWWPEAALLRKLAASEGWLCDAGVHKWNSPPCDTVHAYSIDSLFTWCFFLRIYSM